MIEFGGGLPRQTRHDGEKERRVHGHSSSDHLERLSPTPCLAACRPARRHPPAAFDHALSTQPVDCQSRDARLRRALPCGYQVGVLVRTIARRTLSNPPLVLLLADLLLFREDYTASAFIRAPAIGPWRSLRPGAARCSPSCGFAGRGCSGRSAAGSGRCIPQRSMARDCPAGRPPCPTHFRPATSRP